MVQCYTHREHPAQKYKDKQKFLEVALQTATEKDVLQTKFFKTTTTKIRSCLKTDTLLQSDIVLPFFITALPITIFHINDSKQ